MHVLSDQDILFQEQIVSCPLHLPNISQQKKREMKVRAKKAAIHNKEEQNNVGLRTQSCFCAPFEFFLSNNPHFSTLNIHPSGFSSSFPGFPQFLSLFKVFVLSLIGSSRVRSFKAVLQAKSKS